MYVILRRRGEFSHGNTIVSVNWIPTITADTKIEFQITWTPR